MSTGTELGEAQRRELETRGFKYGGPIGEGMFGTAHVCHHGNRPLVCKVVDLARLSQSPHAERLLQKQDDEITILKLIRHPNIVSFYDFFVVGDIGGHLFLLQEFCDAGDLGKQLEERKKNPRSCFTEARLTKWLLEMCLALRYLHAHDPPIVHRDIKPENIFLIGSSGQIKVGDFGLAKILEETLARTQCGTPYYVPPEQCRRDGVTGKGDMWAVGVIMFELITGEKPFNGKDVMDLFTHIQNDTPPSLKRYAPLYSEDFRNLVLALLEKDPRKRPSAQDCLDTKVLTHAAAHRLPELKKAINQTAARAPYLPTPPERRGKDEDGSDSDKEYQNDGALPTPVRRGTVTQSPTKPSTPSKPSTPTSNGSPTSGTPTKSPTGTSNGTPSKAPQTPTKAPSKEDKEVEQPLTSKNIARVEVTERHNVEKVEYYSRLQLQTQAYQERVGAQKYTPHPSPPTSTAADPFARMRQDQAASELAQTLATVNAVREQAEIAKLVQKGKSKGILARIRDLKAAKEASPRSPAKKKD